MEAFLSSLPPYVHEFLDKEPPFEVFNVLRELICFAVLYSNDRKHIQRQTQRLLEENAEAIQAVETASREQENRPTEEESSTDPESTLGGQANESEQLVPEQTNKSPIPSSFPEWWGHLGSQEESIEKDDSVKGKSQDETFSSPKEQSPGQKSDSIHKVKREKSTPYTAWIPMDTPSTRPKSTIISSSNSVPKSKPAANIKRHSIAITPSRRQTKAYGYTKENTEHHQDSKPQGLEKKAQTVSARLSYLAQPKRMTEPVKVTRSETMPSTIHVAVPRTVQLAKPAQTALVKARSIRARKTTEEKPPSPVFAPVPAYVQNAKSKVDWDAIKRERRNTQLESESIDFIPVENADDNIEHVTERKRDDDDDDVRE